MTTAAFVFFYLLAAILAMQKPVLILWGLGIYFTLVFRRIWLPWSR